MEDGQDYGARNSEKLELEFNQIASDENYSS